MPLDTIGRPCPEVTNMYIRVHNLTQCPEIIHSHVCLMFQGPKLCIRVRSPKLSDVPFKLFSRLAVRLRSNVVFHGVGVYALHCVIIPFNFHRVHHDV
jgi:hypothetical protein